MPDALRLTIDGPLARVTLDRPDKSNALRAADRADLRAACAELAQRSDLRAAVITGAGDKVFCAGIDLTEIRSAMTSPDAFRAFNADLTETFGAVAALPCLTIARMGGTAAGAGLALALACDLRVAADHAGFFYPVVKRGVVPPAADVRRLVALISPARAKALLISGRRIDAQTALNWGLIDAAAPLADLDTAIDDHLQGVLEAPTAQIAALKQVANGADDSALGAAYEALFGGGDHL